MILWTAFIVGLLGSMHCIGMCGPITLALPGFHNNLPRVISSRFLYNAGRTITYAFMGAVIGLAGEGMQKTHVVGKCAKVWDEIGDHLAALASWTKCPRTLD